EDPKKISLAGGRQPRWRGDGKELFFLGPDGKMMAVAMRTSGASIEPATPQALFDAHPMPGPTAYTNEYDVTADGKRFLLITAADHKPATIQLNVVVNWETGVSPARR